MTKKNESKTNAPAVQIPQRLLIPLMLGAALLWAAATYLPVVGDALHRRDRFVLDQYHRNGIKTAVRDDIVILGIDDASRKLDSLWPEDLEASPALKAMKQAYPFPRRVWGYVLDRLFDAGAKVVFLDLTFGSPSFDPEDDRLLKEALERHKGRVVIGAKFENQENSDSGGNSQVALMAPTATLGSPDSHPYGILNFWADVDDVIRTVNFTVTATQAEWLMGTREAVVNPYDKVHPHVTKLIASMAEPGSLEGLPNYAHLRFSPADSYLYSSLMNLFVADMWQNNFGNGAFFKDRIVMIGAVATDLQDFQQTPLGRVAGVNLHAQTYAALLARSFVQKSPPWWNIAATVTGLVVAWLTITIFRQPLVCLIALIAFAVGAVYVGGWAFDYRNLEISPLPFGIPLVLCGIVGLTGDFLVQMRETKKLKRFLARYTSPEIMEEMLKDREGLYTTLKGVGRNVTVLFSDVRSFTSMSEGMSPQEIVTQLNEYLSVMVEKVFRQKGLVDKFIGDAVMALWGSTRALQDQAELKADAVKAVASALNMRAALKELNVGWVARGMPELHFGIGIHQGPVVVGNIGSESPFEKMDFTVIGDSVNTASRLEGATKEYGVDLIVSAEVQKHICGDFVCRSADLVAVKGKVKPVEVCTVTGPRSEGEPAGLDEYEDGVTLYRKGDFTAAMQAFENAATAGLDDHLTRMYQQRCRNLIASPPENWTGVYVMTKK